MTTTEDLTRALEADADVAREKLVATLNQLFQARQAKNEASKDDTKLSAAIKQYLELAGEGEELLDREHGIRAFLTSTRRTEWDLRPLTDDVVIALKHAGLLTIQTAAFDALRKAAPSTVADDVLATPGVRSESENYSLQVKAVER